MPVSAQSLPGQTDPADRLYADDRFMVRDARQIQHLLQAMADQRSPISVHPDGRDLTFPSAVLRVDADGLLLDASPSPAINRVTEAAASLLCFGRVNKVTVRFQLQGQQQIQNDGLTAFSAPLPLEAHHLQRRELYRLETPVGDSPYCLLPEPDGAPAQRWRVLDINAGGLALMLPSPQQLLRPQAIHRQCVLDIPDTPPIVTDLVVCNLHLIKQPNGTESIRAGLRFDTLPRGADTLIQRYIFRIDRLRKARSNGD